MSSSIQALTSVLPTWIGHLISRQLPPRPSSADKVNGAAQPFEWQKWATYWCAQIYKVRTRTDTLKHIQIYFPWLPERSFKCHWSPGPRGGLLSKSTGCSFRGHKFNPQHQMIAYNRLWLTFEEIGCLSMTSSGSWHVPVSKQTNIQEK